MATGNVPQEEPSFACSLTRALLLLKPSVAKGIKDKWTLVIFNKHGINESHHTMTWRHFLEHYPQAVDDLQKKLGLCLLVIKTCYPFSKKEKQQRLVYDGRYTTHEPPYPLKCLWLGPDDRVLQCVDSVATLPHLSKKGYRRKQISLSQPLWKLLGVDEKTSPEVLTWPTPTCWADIKKYVERFRQPQTKVKVKYATGLGKNSFIVDWFQDPESLPSDIYRIIYIITFTNVDYGWSFALELEPGLEKAQQRGQRVQQEWSRYQASWEKWKEKENKEGCSNAHQANCAAAVNVSHKGLQLAYDLGFLSKNELKRLSQELSETFATLYIFVDERHHLRHITYYDTKKTFDQEVVCFEHHCADLNQNMSLYQQKMEERRRNEAVTAMLSFWKEVWKCRSYWMEQRRKILEPLMNHLEQLIQGVSLSESQLKSKRKGSSLPKQMTSPIWRCFQELNQIIGRHRLYLYSKEDSHLHSIKFYLTHFAYQHFKSCRGLFIKAQSDDTLTKISIPGLTVCNLNTYLSCKKDVDFFASLAQPWIGPCPSDVIIAHDNKSLAKQKVSLGPTQLINTRAYCHQYGWMFARHTFRYWVQFCQFILDLFGFDLHGQSSPPSASFLAFQCIWTRYATLAGPMAHGLERCKPYYEDLLRESSRGGLMFSIGDVIHQGGPLHPLLKDTKACSIAEFDLVSAYGFGASQALIPAGFCVGYQKLTDSHWLERLNSKLRHKSFEFRAVYKVIDKLSRRQGIPLRTVYHNYSPLGLFTLGKYNLDLVVVQEDGKMLLINMDGRWIHGCDICPSTGSFAHGQSHQQVRAKSHQRDREIEAWVKVINANSVASGGPPDLVEYLVIHDCHSPGYTLSNLNQSFAQEPTLQTLIQGYQMTHQLGREFTVGQFQDWLMTKEHDASFTFILKGQVSIQQPNMDLIDPDGSLTLGPLVIYDTIDKNAFTDGLNDANYKTLDGRSKRNSTRQRLAWEGQVALTRDYYQWLVKTFPGQFFLHQMDWILFYKTEPVINTIYRQLVDMRSTTSDPILVTFLKKLVNLSAGFFGNRSTPLVNKTTYRLVKSVPEKFAFFRHTLIHQHAMDLANDSYFVLETKPWPKTDAHRQPSRSALSIFFTIVEYGKLRLAQVLHFLRQHLVMKNFRLVYSNIDNLILVLANDATCLKEAVHPDCRSNFDLKQSLYFTASPLVKSPGLAECKWSRQNGQWTFTTLRTQHYCLAHENLQQSLFKVSGWSDVTPQQVVEWTQQLFQGHRVAIPQTRRTRKTLGMDTRDIVIHY